MWADQALERVLQEENIRSILDVGSGSGTHASHFRAAGREVTTVDINPDYKADHSWDYNLVDHFDIIDSDTFDCVWASHVLEHQADVNNFIQACLWSLKDNGLLAITVPPRKDEIVGGHLTLWNPGLLVYNLIVAGLDCSQARVGHYDYNISVLVRKKLRPEVKLVYDSGDITTLTPFFPTSWSVKENFPGWQSANW